MALSDLDVQHQAHTWIQRHGDGAVAKARQMVEEMRRKGDDDGADLWLRVIVALGTLGTPATRAHH
jgi:hypothetical protein